MGVKTLIEIFELTNEPDIIFKTKYMKHKYNNFKIDDSYKTEQEPVKTNHAGLEALRQQQMRGREPRPVTVAHTVSTVTMNSFNEWSNHISSITPKP